MNQKKKQERNINPEEIIDKLLPIREPEREHKYRPVSDGWQLVRRGREEGER